MFALLIDRVPCRAEMVTRGTIETQQYSYVALFLFWEGAGLTDGALNPLRKAVPFWGQIGSNSQ